ncbi:MAG: multidrug ABC transporter ATP-binding protein [Spirochaetae bacterium HGW-Spirochaetae-1]|jgi:ABC-2 type transport system ATP-binding protein|nr:MAG: multidrug ABC transporter ATP-binding protein [Spirochaetae bacterium HGW-Spirochaetae-1]
MEYSVDVRNLTRTFGDFTAVNNVSFSVKKGEIFGFLGPNGAGKSTTIKMLCGLLMPSSGEGHVAGMDIMDQQEEIKKIIGYMSQRFSLYDDLSVKENLEFFGSIYGLQGARLRERMEFVIDMVGLEERRDSLVKNLPGGIKQRLSLGTAIIHDPPVLFLDEPTSGVDPLMRRTFWEQIYAFSAQGKTIFVTTHYMDEAEHCDRIALIIAGTIIALDTPDSLKNTIPSDVFLIRSDSFLDTFEILSRQDFVQEAALFGTDIHIIVKDGRGITQRIRSLLEEKDGKRIMIRKIRPSLEDVFVVHSRNYGL